MDRKEKEGCFKKLFEVAGGFLRDIEKVCEGLEVMKSQVYKGFVDEILGLIKYHTQNVSSLSLEHKLNLKAYFFSTAQLH